MRRLDDGRIVATRAEAAVRIGKSERTLQRWIASGDLPPVYKAKDGRTRIAFYDMAKVLEVDEEMDGRTGGRPAKAA